MFPTRDPDIFLLSRSCVMCVQRVAQQSNCLARAKHKLASSSVPIKCTHKLDCTLRSTLYKYRKPREHDNEKKKRKKFKRIRKFFRIEKLPFTTRLNEKQVRFKENSNKFILNNKFLNPLCIYLNNFNLIFNFFK